MSRFAMWLGCAGLSIVLAAVSVQAAEVAPDLKRKINIAGKQRMLSQRMARAACLASQGVMVAKQNQIWEEANAAFAKALAGLRSGDEDLMIRTEAHPQVLEALSSVDRVWPGYAASLDRARGDVASLPEVAMRSLSVLKAANDVVVALEGSTDGTGVSQELARLINVAGRQRMLTQRAAKEYCLIAAGIEPEMQREALAATVALFDRSLEGLRRGDDEMGLLAAPDEVIEMQLEYVADLWTPLRAQFQKAIDGLPPSPTGLGMVAANIDSVLSAANEAVWLYENF